MSDTIIDTMKQCLMQEAQALMQLTSTINEKTLEFAQEIADCKGKIVFTGVGKSYIVASKIAGTLSSIGVSCTHLDPLSMLHGDLGFIDSDDMVIALSNSGETNILIETLKCIASTDTRILSITGNGNSTIAEMSYKTVEIKTEEAGPFGLVPTTSTTCIMAFGDAIACAMIQLKNLTIEDFKRNHPNGELSKI